MKMDISESERNAAILLSSASCYILQQIAALMDELEKHNQLIQEKVKENNKLLEEIGVLEAELDNLRESTKSEPALSQK